MTETIRFPISGMTCSSCVSRITRALKKVPGVERVKVDLGNETATVRRLPTLGSDEALSAAVASAGYEADLAAAVPVEEIEKRSLLERLFGRR